MSDPIAEWVDASIENAGKTTGHVGLCPHCKANWHGLPYPYLGCPGSHVPQVNPDDIHDAILEWDNPIFERGDQ